MPKALHHFLQKADLIFGIGCSFTTPAFGVAMPKGKRIIHATLDPADLNKNVEADEALLGDARLILIGAERRDRADARRCSRARSRDRSRCDRRGPKTLARSVAKES